VGGNSASAPSLTIATMSFSLHFPRLVRADELAIAKHRQAIGVTCTSLIRCEM
jgi:hypothetical protein